MWRSGHPEKPDWSRQSLLTEAASKSSAPVPKIEFEFEFEFEDD